MTLLVLKLVLPPLFEVALVAVVLIQPVILLVLRARSTDRAGGLTGRADEPACPAPVARGRAR